MKAIFFVGICAWAQVKQPRVGMMLDGAGSVRPVLGISASVTLGDPVAAGVVSMACERICVKRDTPAVIAFGGGSVYVYSAGRLTKDDQPLDVSVAGEVLSMRAARGVLEFAVRRGEGVWIVREDGAAVGSIPEADGPVMLLERGVLFATGDETVLRWPDGSEIRFPIHADSFVRMSADYVQIRSGGSSYALRVVKDREKLFALPEAP